MVIELRPFFRRISPLLQWAFLGGQPGLQRGAAALPAAGDQRVAEPFGAGLTGGHALKRGRVNGFEPLILANLH
jgi:hypothetical protein